MANIPIRYIRSSQPEPSLGDSFTIRDIDQVLAGTDMVQHLHRHDFFFLLVLERGQGKHQIDFKEYEITDHSVFMMRPGQVHELVLKAGSSGYIIGFKSDFNRGDKAATLALRKATAKNHCDVGPARFGTLLSLMRCIFREFNDKDDGYEDVIRSTMNIFLIELLRHPHFRQGTSESNKPYAEERLDQFLQLLEKHVAKHKEVSYYAETLNLSVYQLNAITKAMAGKTASEVISEHLILEARRYLLATSDQVNQIAYRLGYTDPSYFTRFFRKRTGYSPEAFRNNFS